MAIDFKNIVFKYVRIVGGTPSIDADMTDEKFFATKPTGYYRCFIFTKADFAGVGYNDLVNLVSIEEQYMWDKTNRDTFLGYNEATNTFICNINAYMGLKDSDLKTDGEMPYAGMVGWYEMEIATVPSGAIITLKQTDGSDIYLKIKPNVIGSGNKTSKGNICIEHTKKKVSESTVFIKNDALWCKSPEDNSALMVQNNLARSPAGGSSFSYINSNKIIHYNQYNRNFQSFMYGKPVIYFPDSTGNGLVSVEAFSTEDLFIKNNTGKDHVEYTETSDLNDILNSGEYLVFIRALKSKYVFACKRSLNPIDYPAVRNYDSAPTKYFSNRNEALNTFSDYSDPANEGLSCDLISLDPKDKPFMYIAPERDILLSGTNKTYMEFIVNGTSNIPDGFIFLTLGKIKSLGNNNTYFIRYKNGDQIKIRQTSGVSLSKISGATGFGTDIYYIDGNHVNAGVISKDDLINATGFSNVDDTKFATITLWLSSGSVTVYKI